MNTHPADTRPMMQEARKHSNINVSQRMNTQHLFSVNFTAKAELFVYIYRVNVGLDYFWVPEASFALQAKISVSAREPAADV